MSDTKNFVWTDELAEKFAKEYRFSSSRISLDMFKAAIQSEEKDIPKDWEIISYSYKGWVYKKNHLGEYCTILEAPLHLLLLHPENMDTIHSVKRLSDGEVFTIGDEINFGKIIAFWIGDYNQIYATFEGGRHIEINAIEKVIPKVPLFTTKDGVETFKGIKYWWVDLHPNNDAEKYTIYSYDFDRHCNMGDPRHYSNKYKYFITEKKAKEWVLLNKPIQVSYNELKDFLNSRFDCPCADYETVLDFFKSKINP